jgi:hypothetical protein
MSPSRGETSLLGWTIVIAVATVIILVLTYLVLASGTHILPYSSPPTRNNGPVSPGGAQADGLPTSYQATWDASISLGITTVQISLTLGRGSPGQVVGTISSVTLNCDADVLLSSTGNPIQLSFKTASNQGACQLASVITDVSITLVDSNYLKFSFEVYGLFESCRMSRAA